MRINNFSNNLFLSNRINTYNKLISINLQKLSTGKRINSAADSPSDILKISRFEAEVRGSRVAQRNIQDGISFLQVVDNALSQIKEIGQRLRELSIQYNSDILTAEDKNAIENEAKELFKEIKHIIENTRFGGLKVFDKDSYIIQTGPYSGDIYEIKLPDLSHLKEISISGQQNPPPTYNDRNINNDENNEGNVGGTDDGHNNDNGNIGGIGDNNDDDNVGGVDNGGNDDNGDIGGIGDDNNSGNVGDVGNNDDNGDVGGIEDGNDDIGDAGNDDNSNDNGGVGGIGDSDDNGDVGGIGNNDGDGDVGGIGDNNDNIDPSLNGYQKIYNQQGVLIYDGYMQNGKYHGYGKLYSDEGVLLYDGYWNEGIYHHYGKLYNEQGQLMYQGYWENGKRQGYGTAFYPNGRIQYEGNWYNDVYHGWGKSFDENGQLIYEGEWVNGQPKTQINTGLLLFSPLRISDIKASDIKTLEVANKLGSTLSSTSTPKVINELSLDITSETDIPSNQNIELPTEDNSVPEELNISDILKNEFIDNNILKPITGAISHVGVMSNILSHRLESQIYNEDLKWDAMSNVTDVDIAKELMGYIKNQMQLDTNIMLLVHNLSNQKESILRLLTITQY